jgi:hypothetical protein
MKQIGGSLRARLRALDPELRQGYLEVVDDLPREGEAVTRRARRSLPGFASAFLFGHFRMDGLALCSSLHLLPQAGLLCGILGIGGRRERRMRELRWGCSLSSAQPQDGHQDDDECDGDGDQSGHDPRD